MEKEHVAMCCIFGLLGLLSAIAGFAAEDTRIKASQVRITYGGCSYPKSPATAYGIVAAASLLFVRIIMSFTIGCCCCIRTPSTKSNITIVRNFDIISWIASVIAIGLLIAGAKLNDDYSVYNTDNYRANYECYVVKPGVFAAGALLSLASTILGMFGYIQLKSADNKTNSSLPVQGDIAIGQPQFSPTRTPQRETPVVTTVEA